MTYIAHRGSLISYSSNKIVKEGKGFMKTFNSIKRDVQNTSNKVVHSANHVIVPVVNNSSVGGFYDNAVKPVRGGAILSSVSIPHLKKRTDNNIRFNFN